MKNRRYLMENRYYVMHDKVSNTHSVYQNVGGKDWHGLLVAEYTDQFAAEYICEQLNQLVALEASE
jgi:hypothetical protein